MEKMDQRGHFWYNSKPLQWKIQNSHKDFCSHTSLMLPRKRKRGKEEVANASSKKYSIYWAILQYQSHIFF